MTFSLGKFFPSKTVNEPMLNLDDTRWKDLEGGYKGMLYDASLALLALQKAETLQDAAVIYEELWDELHHQGDVGMASYYAVPHMVKIADEKKLVDHNVLGLVSLIEIQRHKNNPAIPSALLPAYERAIKQNGQLAFLMMSKDWDLNLSSAVLTAIALAKGQTKQADAIMNLDSEDVIDEFLEMY